MSKTIQKLPIGNRGVEDVQDDLLGDSSDDGLFNIGER
jgi:hypothetical protein